MDVPTILMWLAVTAAAGVAFRNPAAAALVLAWMAGAAVSVRTGEALPLWFYPYADIAAAAIIMGKSEQTLADRTVLLLYTVCWLFYISGIHEYHLYYALWAITLTQFLAVGWEASTPLIRRMRAAIDTPSIPPGFQFAWAVRGDG